MGAQIASCEGAISRGKDMLGHVRRHSAVSCAKRAKPIEMPFGLWTRIIIIIIIIIIIHSFLYRHKVVTSEAVGRGEGSM